MPPAPSPRLDRAAIFSLAVQRRTVAGVALNAAREALVATLTPEALALNDSGLSAARKAAETFLFAEARYAGASEVVLALSAYAKAPLAELSEPHTVEDTELWAVSKARGGVLRWLSTPGEARGLAARVTEQGQQETTITYFAPGASAREGIDVDPGEDGWLDLSDTAMRPTATPRPSAGASPWTASPPTSASCPSCSRTSTDSSEDN